MAFPSSMQKLITFTALVACLTPTTVTVVQSTPLEYNPVTTCENVVPLTHDHPAYGAVLAPTANTQYEDRTYPEDLAEEEDRMTVDSGSNSAIGGSVASEAFDNGTITFAGEHIGGENATTDTGSVLASVRRLETSSSDIGRLETYFKTSMEKNAKKLATKGNAPTMPWPSSYWPVYLDGINYQWSQNQPSPAEKYATAFGLNTQTFMASISQATGILSQSTRTSCFSNAQCTSLGDGSVCAKRAGQWQGYCIPSWFGICHAWTPAAILESEPKCAVTKNGVTFQVMDIKALLTQIYDGAQLETVFTGVRFNGVDSTTPKDKYGRYTDSSRRDLGPGYMHIAMANILGRFKKTFILDVTGGAEVWNQPIYSYEVLKQTEMTTQQGAKKYFNTNKYPFNSKAKSLMYVQTKVTWMVEALEDGPLVTNGRANLYTNSDTYSYLLELDSSKNIIGGEWVDKSKDDHPDFLWFATGKPADSTVTSVGLSYNTVRSLLEDSLKC
jgi:hypothetical protein